MGTSSQTSQTLWAFRAGHRLGASPRAQIGAQVLGALLGGDVVVPVYLVIVRSYGIGTETMPAVAALSWKATAEAVRGGLSALPPHGPPAGGLGLGLGDRALRCSVARASAASPPRPPRWGWRCCTRVVLLRGVRGRVGRGRARRLRPSLDEPRVMALAAGGIAGESVMGVIVRDPDRDRDGSDLLGGGPLASLLSRRLRPAASVRWTPVTFSVRRPGRGRHDVAAHDLLAAGRLGRVLDHAPARRGRRCSRARRRAPRRAPRARRRARLAIATISALSSAAVLAVGGQHARADDGAAGLQRQRQPGAAEALLGRVEDRGRVVEHLVAVGVGAVGDPDLDVDGGGRHRGLGPRSSSRPPRAAPR